MRPGLAPLIATRSARGSFRNELLLAVPLAVLAVGFGMGTKAVPGVTRTSILLGGTAPITGPLSAGANVARGAAAYFAYVNAHGGVSGRKIVYRYLDDASDPRQTVALTRGLVLRDRAFAVFSPVGTEQSVATRPFLNQFGVPQLFVASGADTFGRDARKYRWSIGFGPSDWAEGAIYLEYLAKASPKARIAILYPDDETTQDLVATLRRALGPKARIVATAGYDPAAPSVRKELARLHVSRADTLMIFAAGRFAVDALVQADRLRWKPNVFVGQAGSDPALLRLASQGGANTRTEGAISAVFVKDPASRKWAGDRGIKLFRAIAGRYGGGASFGDVSTVEGMAAGYAMVDALRRVGRNLTRARVMHAVTHLDELDNPFLLPGIPVSTTPADRFPISKAGLQRWHDGRWVAFGGLSSARG